VPDRAELAIGAAVIALVLSTDLRGAIGFSSFGVLLYYAVANAAAFTQSGEHRRWPRALNVAGGIACVVFVASLPASSIVAGLAVLAVGVAGRALVIESRRRERAERLSGPRHRMTRRSRTRARAARASVNNDKRRDRR
jgi:APA family basic amino acid/polyamine antiporter